MVNDRQVEAADLERTALERTIDPTGEDAYWSKNYTSRYDVEAEEPYDVYRPAYEQGWTARRNQPDRSWDEVEPELARRWAGAANKTGLGWDRAGLAAHDAWDRALSSWFAEEDGYWWSAFASLRRAGFGGHPDWPENGSWRFPDGKEATTLRSRARATGLVAGG